MLDLISGKAKATMVHEDGKQSIVRFIQKDEFIGELFFIGVEDVPKDVIAINECVCLSFPMYIATKELLGDVNFLLLINRYIGGKYLNRTWVDTKSSNYELKTA